MTTAAVKLDSLLALPGENEVVEFNEANLKRRPSLSRKGIDELLWNKLPEWMTDKQRKIEIGNLLGELKRANRITREGAKKFSSWALVKIVCKKLRINQR